MSAYDSGEIARRRRSVAAEVFREYPDIVLAYLYGSVARGQALPASDVDVGVVLAVARAGADGLGLELRLESELAEATGLDDVDVRILNDGPLLVQGASVTEGVRVYERDEASRVGYETWARSRYFDYLPSARAMAAAFEGALRERLAHARSNVEAGDEALRGMTASARRRDAAARTATRGAAADNRVHGLSP